MMLNLITKKLCPLISLTVATIGCGKKINETQIVDAQNTVHQERPSELIISSEQTFLIDQNYSFKVPQVIHVTSGDPTHSSATIIYNMDEFSDFDMKCHYVYNGTPDLMTLTGCADYGDRDFGDVTDQPFSLYQGYSVKLEVTPVSSNLTLEAQHELIWSWE